MAVTKKICVRHAVNASSELAKYARRQYNTTGGEKKKIKLGGQLKDQTAHSNNVLPVRVRDGMVPRERALFRRPGKEDDEALRCERLACWFSNCRRPGGVENNADDKSGRTTPLSKFPNWEAGSPETYL